MTFHVLPYSPDLYRNRLWNKRRINMTPTISKGLRLIRSSGSCSIGTNCFHQNRLQSVYKSTQTGFFGWKSWFQKNTTWDIDSSSGVNEDRELHNQELSVHIRTYAPVCTVEIWKIIFFFTFLKTFFLFNQNKWRNFFFALVWCLCVSISFIRFLFHKPPVKNVKELMQRDDDGYENVT